MWRPPAWSGPAWLRGLLAVWGAILFTFDVATPGPAEWTFVLGYLTMMGLAAVLPGGGRRE